MSERVPKCPKCGPAMDEGFVLDERHRGVTQSSWVEGEPVPSFWSGLKLSGHLRLKVSTFRCPKCGYLESYAPAQ
ncbi:MAG: hypothetical protein EXS08_02140 [Planctomycetes bacterium]|nr:hypothetical protein [Planctomycetota bacterium]